LVFTAPKGGSLRHNLFYRHSSSLPSPQPGYPNGCGFTIMPTSALCRRPGEGPAVVG